MKKQLLAAALALASLTAAAGPFYLTGATAYGAPANFDVALPTGFSLSNAFRGTLNFDGTSYLDAALSTTGFKVEYIGAESSLVNRFIQVDGDDPSFNTVFKTSTSTAGDLGTNAASAGVVDFSFRSFLWDLIPVGTSKNGTANGFANILFVEHDTDGSWLAMFNDPGFECGCSKDYDDMVVRFSTGGFGLGDPGDPTNPVPEPQSLALMGAGLVALGLTTGRRRRVNRG